MGMGIGGIAAAIGNQNSAWVGEIEANNNTVSQEINLSGAFAASDMLDIIASFYWTHGYGTSSNFSIEVYNGAWVSIAGGSLGTASGSVQLRYLVSSTKSALFGSGAPAAIALTMNTISKIKVTISNSDASNYTHFTALECIKLKLV
jgi:predicted amidohydrolase